MTSHFKLPYPGKKSRGKFSSGKNLVTSEKLVTFPWPIFKIKRTFMSGTAFFLEKSYSLCLRFFKLSVEECIIGVTNPWNSVLQIRSFMDIAKQKVFVQVNFPRL